MRIALLEASHWHTPLYLPALAQPGVQVVAMSNREPAGAAAVARQFGCPLYGSYGELLQRHPIDFAFVFGRHADMPAIGAALIERRIPFSLEKPCGTSGADVRRLRASADAQRLFVAVPFIFRIGELLRALRAAEGALPARFHHVSFRFVVGAPSRYVDSGSPWMLDPVVAGGGCTINLATHFIDLFRVLTGSDIVTVAARMSNRGHATPVEDHSVLLLTAADGTTGIVETGYTFPSAPDEQRECSFSLSTDKAYYRSAPGALLIRDRADPASATRAVPVALDTDIYYAKFVAQTLADVASGKPPIAGLGDAEAMMHVMDAAYASARSGGAPCAVRQ